MPFSSIEVKFRKIYHNSQAPSECCWNLPTWLMMAPRFAILLGIREAIGLPTFTIQKLCSMPKTWESLVCPSNPVQIFKSILWPKNTPRCFRMSIENALNLNTKSCKLEPKCKADWIIWMLPKLLAPAVNHIDDLIPSIWVSSQRLKLPWKSPFLHSILSKDPHELRTTPSIRRATFVLSNLTLICIISPIFYLLLVPQKEQKKWSVSVGFSSINNVQYVCIFMSKIKLWATGDA
jgi:hypothetical protein